MESQAKAIYLTKAQESMEGAASELANGRFNNCANRCYYACFQAAIAGLLSEGIRSSHGEQWTHAFVHSQFAGSLVSRRKIYPASLRDTLAQNLMLRQRADYEDQYVTEAQARRALGRTRQFLDAIYSEGGERL